MQAFQVLPKRGWFSFLEESEARMLAEVFFELATAMEAEEKRGVLDMMGVEVDAETPRNVPLMFEKIFGEGQVSSFDSAPVSSLPDAGCQPDSSLKSGSGSARAREQDLTDDQRLAELDFDPLSTRPVPANPYIAAILRPMSQDPEAAGELRALTVPDLAARKTVALRTVGVALVRAAQHHAPVVVMPEGLKTWASAINDARLALGWSLGIKDAERADEVEALAESNPDEGEYSAYEIALASVYNALSWWLDSLMHAVSANDLEQGSAADE